MIIIVMFLTLLQFIRNPVNCIMGEWAVKTPPMLLTGQYNWHSTSNTTFFFRKYIVFVTSHILFIPLQMYLLSRLTNYSEASGRVQRTLKQQPVVFLYCCFLSIIVMITLLLTGWKHTLDWQCLLCLRLIHLTAKGIGFLVHQQGAALAETPVKLNEGTHSVSQNVSTPLTFQQMFNCIFS